MANGSTTCVIPSEKREARYEAAYRAMGRTDAADLVLQCREQTGDACSRLLTFQEYQEAYRQFKKRIDQVKPPVAETLVAGFLLKSVAVSQPAGSVLLESLGPFAWGGLIGFATINLVRAFAIHHAFDEEVQKRFVLLPHVPEEQLRDAEPQHSSLLPQFIKDGWKRLWSAWIIRKNMQESNGDNADANLLALEQSLANMRIPTPNLSKQNEAVPDTASRVAEPIVKNIQGIFHEIRYIRKIVIHPNDSGVVLINYPGWAGHVDGYNQKYEKIANHIAQTGLAAVVRMDNPDLGIDYATFVIQGIYEVVKFVQENAKEICGQDKCHLWLMGFSAGAGAIAVTAQQVGAEKILLMAPAADAGMEGMLNGLKNFTGDVAIVLGEQDHIVSTKFAEELFDMASNAKSRKIKIIPNCDHQFRGTINGQIMSKAPEWAFKNDRSFPSPDGGLILY